MKQFSYSLSCFPDMQLCRHCMCAEYMSYRRRFVPKVKTFKKSFQPKGSKRPVPRNWALSGRWECGKSYPSCWRKGDWNAVGGCQ